MLAEIRSPIRVLTYQNWSILIKTKLEIEMKMNSDHQVFFRKQAKNQK
jgi:hypothetical protein